MKLGGNFMQLCANLLIKDISSKDFDEIAQTVKNYFSSPEYKPEYFEYWIESAKYNKTKQEITVGNDTHADPDEYGGFLTELIEKIAEQHTAVKLSGYYDLYNDDFGSDYYLFTLNNGKLEWKEESEGEEESNSIGSIEEELMIGFAIENGYKIQDDYDIDDVIDFLRGLADSGNEEAQEMIDDCDF